MTPSEIKCLPWPAWARALAHLRTESDTGIGDTIARTIGPIGGDAYKAWHKKAFGRECNCAKRQAWLNRRFPYPSTNPARQLDGKPSLT